jgi:hypothetical protein
MEGAEIRPPPPHVGGHAPPPPRGLAVPWPPRAQPGARPGHLGAGSADLSRPPHISWDTFFGVWRPGWDLGGSLIFKKLILGGPSGFIPPGASDDTDSNGGLPDAIRPSVGEVRAFHREPTRRGGRDAFHTIQFWTDHSENLHALSERGGARALKVWDQSEKVSDFTGKPTRRGIFEHRSTSGSSTDRPQTLHALSERGGARALKVSAESGKVPNLTPYLPGAKLRRPLHHSIFNRSRPKLGYGH